MSDKNFPSFYERSLPYMSEVRKEKMVKEFNNMVDNRIYSSLSFGGKLKFLYNKNIRSLFARGKKSLENIE